jgi:hypothetical protein
MDSFTYFLKIQPVFMLTKLFTLYTNYIPCDTNASLKTQKRNTVVLEL